MMISDIPQRYHITITDKKTNETIYDDIYYAFTYGDASEFALSIAEGDTDTFIIIVFAERES